MDILYEHQRAALNQLRSGSILCGGVGTGKSRTALAFFFVKECGGSVEPEWRPMTKPKDLYIITTARKRDTKEWEAEMLPFLLGTPGYSPPVTVDSWNNIQKYVDIKNAFFIFDEQRVVGSGKWAKSFIHITRSNRWILLSATPGDTWMDYVPVFIANGFYRNRSDFIRQHVVYSRYITKFPKVDRYVNEGLLIKHRRDILVTMSFHRMTEQHKHRLIAEFDKDLTRHVIKDRWDIFNEEPIQDAGGLCRVIRKIANTDPSRRRLVESVYDRHKRVIVFYNFDYELDILRTLCEENQIVYSEWNGHKHEEIPNAKSWIYLVQYNAGAEGWNCIETDTILFYSQNYSYKIMVQAAGRIDRLNTPYHDLHYYTLVSRSPIDLAILQALSNKKDFNESSFAASQ